MDTRTERYENPVIGSAQTPERESVMLVVPDVKVLTKARRLAIGRALIEAARGEDGLAAWAAATEVERVRWTNCHMGKYAYVELSYYDGADGEPRASYNTPTSGGGNYPAGDILVMAVTA